MPSRGRGAASGEEEIFSVAFPFGKPLTAFPENAL
jgi:hypothetical protein